MKVANQFISQYFLATPAITESLGGYLAMLCQEKSILYLNGELGTGKTTLVRGFLRALGYSGIVKSPTYTLVEPYYFNQLTVYHFDLYRLGDAEELEYIGIRDYTDRAAICLIEWPERGGAFIPPADIEIHLSYHRTGRLLQLKTHHPLPPFSAAEEVID